MRGLPLDKPEAYLSERHDASANGPWQFRPASLIISVGANKSSRRRRTWSVCYSTERHSWYFGEQDKRLTVARANAERIAALLLTLPARPQRLGWRAEINIPHQDYPLTDDKPVRQGSYHHGPQTGCSVPSAPRGCGLVRAACLLPCRNLPAIRGGDMPTFGAAQKV
jgi:hypothetical protein